MTEGIDVLMTTTEITLSRCADCTFGLTARDFLLAVIFYVLLFTDNFLCYYSPEGGINHAVSAIGYGYKDGELFWVIKNSWGESWGSDGYLYITAKNNNCNVMMTPYYVIVTE